MAGELDQLLAAIRQRLGEDRAPSGPLNYRALKAKVLARRAYLEGCDHPTLSEQVELRRIVGVLGTGAPESTA